MKLSEIRIQNLRGYRDETVTFNDYTCLVGPNGAGKSTVLCALCIFFRETEYFATNLHVLQPEDFHCMGTAEPIKITVTFTDLTPEAQEDFKEYYRQDKLVVTATATFNDESKTADVKQAGQRMVMKAFSPYFAADSEKASAADLKAIYESIRKIFPDLPTATTKPKMAESLNAYEEAHPEKTELLSSPDQFYGFSQGANRFAKYLQWVYIPAVKDASHEQTEAKTSALGKLLARTVRSKIKFKDQIDAIRKKVTAEYADLLDKNQGSLTDLSTALKTRLQEWAHPAARLKLEWRGSADKAIKVDEPLAQIIAGEGDFDGELSRFGHGLQRCYLLALLQELSGSADTTGPRLILGCEEPELHQHPPQLRHLANVLYHLSKKNSQIIVSTHSPYFVSGERFEDVRMIRKAKGTNSATISQVTVDDLAKTIAEAQGQAVQKAETATLKLQQALLPSINEIFFTRVAVLLEGQEDVAHLTTYFVLLGLWEDFRKHGCHFISADRKSNILRPLAVANRMSIPAFVIFDSDAHKLDKSGSRKKHEIDNKAILNLRGYSTADPMPTATFWQPDTIMWHSEIGEVFAEDAGAALVPIQMDVKSLYDNESGLEKSSLFVAELLSRSWDKGIKSTSLIKACQSIIEFAKNS